MKVNTCLSCNEYRLDAIIKQTGYCRNCSTIRHIYNVCFVCKLHAPCEKHHIIPQALNMNCSLCVPVCLNCHAILTARFVRRVYENTLQKRRDNVQNAIQHALYDIFSVMLERYLYDETETRPNILSSSAYRV